MNGVIDIHEVIEAEVYKAYITLLETMEHEDIAPSLAEIYEEFYISVMDNIEEAYEKIFGEGTPVRSDWLKSLGIDMEGIPNILVVCKVLNYFKLGYMYCDVLYNYMPQPLLRSEDICE